MKLVYDRDELITIQLTGTGFPEGVRADFSPQGTFSAITTTRNSSTSVTVTAQYAEATANPGDTFDLILRKGRFKYNYQNAIEIIDVPASNLAIGTVTPKGIDANGVGVACEILGSGFDGATTVSISGTGVTFVGEATSEASIDGTFTAAIGATAGFRDVTVTKGNETATLPGGLEVIPVVVPVDIVSITPSTMPQGTTRNYTIAGTDFVSGCTVAISGADVTVNSVTFNSSNSLTISATVGGTAATTQRNVTVTNPNASTDTLTNGVTVQAYNPLLIDAAWLSANGPAPYWLEQSGATYVLDTDVTTPGTAFYIADTNITFDLNGHTIFYNSAGGTNKWGICLYVSWSNTEVSPARPGAVTPTGFTYTNGSIVCHTAGDSCHAVYGRGGQNSVCYDMSLTSKGKDSYCVSFPYGNAEISHSYLECQSTTTFNRHQGPAAVKLSEKLTARFNVLKGGNSAFVCGTNSIIEKNVVRHSGFATNGYGGWFYRYDNITCSDNIIIPSNGRGILANAGNNHTYDGNVILHLEAPNAEFGTALNPPAVRARYEARGIVYTNNISLGIAGTGLTGCSTIYLTNYDNQDLPCQFTGNNGTTILVGSPGGNFYAQPVTMESQGLKSGVVQPTKDVIDNNTFRSNHTMVRTSGYDGSSFQERPMIGNTFEFVTGATAATDFETALNSKMATIGAEFLAHRLVQAEALVDEAIAQIASISGQGLQTTRQFWWAMEQNVTGNPTITATVTDSTLGGGVDPETLNYLALRELPCSLRVGYQYTYQLQDPENGNAPVPNVDVTATNNVGDVFTLRSDGSGNVSVPIIEYGMDKPLGINQPFAKVNRTSTTLTVTGFDPWVLTHSEL